MAVLMAIERDKLTVDRLDSVKGGSMVADSDQYLAVQMVVDLVWKTDAHKVVL